jgi:cell division protease FtsH
MVTEFGMSDGLGPMRFGQPQGEVFLGKDFSSRPDYSEEIAARIDEEVRALLGGAHTEARRLLTLHRATLDRLAAALLEHETLQADEVAAILAPVIPEAASELGGARPSALGIREPGSNE